MLVFITSIRNPLNSNSYDKVWKLLGNTLNSVCNQKDQDFKVIVVANKILHKFEDNKKIKEKVEFLKVEFDPPTDINNPKTGRDAIKFDRGTKYIAGLMAARKYNPSHIMFFDADDYVSEKISSLVNENPQENGWFMQDGYLLANDKIVEFSPFFNFCGTSNIVKISNILEEIESSKISETSSQKEIIDSTSDHYLKMIIGSHRFLPEYFEKKGLPMKPFAIPGAIYNMETGENHSFHTSEQHQGWKKVSKEIIDEFSIHLD
jgi:glycosyltransferase involved in cell wall biosynthesis